MEAKSLLAMFGEDDASITVTETTKGLLAHYTEYPEEGAVYLSELDEDAARTKRAKERKALEDVLSKDLKYRK